MEETAGGLDAVDNDMTALEKNPADAVPRLQTDLGQIDGKLVAVNGLAGDIVNSVASGLVTLGAPPGGKAPTTKTPVTQADLAAAVLLEQASGTSKSLPKLDLRSIVADHLNSLRW